MRKGEVILIARDQVWLWCHPPGAHNGRWQLPDSETTPAQALAHLDVGNAIYVVFNNRPEPPFLPHAAELSAASKLVWSIVGDSSSDRTDDGADLDAVLEMAPHCPNLTGVITDDFFLNEPGAGGKQARLSLGELERCRTVLQSLPAPLELWTVVYDGILDRPLQPYLDLCDVVTFWTWKAADLVDVEASFSRLEHLAPGCRKLLGCYLWDYGGDGGEIPPDLMEKQTTLAADWIAGGRIDGVILLASNLCGLEIAGVDYARAWLDRVAPMQG